MVFTGYNSLRGERRKARLRSPPEAVEVACEPENGVWYTAIQEPGALKGFQL